MYLLANYRDAARESAERAVRGPIGWMSPFWFAYGAAVSAGAAWWWMNQFGHPAHLEAVHGDQALGTDAPGGRGRPRSDEGETAAVSHVEAKEERSADALVRPAEAPPEPSPTVEADDLTRIVGIGPRLSAALAERGVTRFTQMAAWTDREISEIDAALKLKGGISRHGWVAQARRFAKEA